MNVNIRHVWKGKVELYDISLSPFFPFSATVVLSLDGRVVEAADVDKLGFRVEDLNLAALLSPMVLAMSSEELTECLISPKEAKSVLTLFSVSRSEETLHFSFEKVEQSTEVVFLLNSEGVIIDCSSHCAPRITGYSRAHFLGHSVNVVVPDLFPLVPMDVNFGCMGVHRDGHDLFLSVTVTKLAEGTCCLRMRRHIEMSSKTNVGKIQFPNLQLGALLGTGAFSVVRLGKWESKGEDELLAVKLVDRKHAKAALKEVNILKLLDHPAIPKLHFVTETPTHVAIGMEFCPGMELGHYIKTMKGPGLPGQECKHYFRQLCSVVSYLHGVGVVHRDLKMENVLVLPDRIDSQNWKKNQIKLIDFGLSLRYQPDVTKNDCCGTLAYAAPEMLAQKPYRGPEIDVWSLGVVLHVMVTGKLPFSSPRAIVEAPFAKIGISNDGCADLLDGMLQKSSATRFTMSEIMSNCWLNDNEQFRFVKCRVIVQTKIESIEEANSERESTEETGRQKRGRSSCEDTDEAKRKSLCKAKLEV